jgi:CubicO group peptidase (beta-lactamase class C family)
LEADYSTAVATELGLDSGRLADLRGRLQHAIDRGPLPSIQVALARHGKVAFFETFGKADASTRYNIFSCTKPLVASVIWHLMGQGLLDISERVSRYIPLFSEQGKQDITVEQVLCHTSGFPHADLDAPDWWTRQGRLDRMREWTLDWVPGSRMEYHPLSAHWVLAELIEVITGEDYRIHLQKCVLDPLGLGGLHLGLPLDKQKNIATVELVGEPPSPQEVRELFGRNVRLPGFAEQSLLMFNKPEVRQLGVPGGGAVGTAADLALFYQALMYNPGGLWRPDVLADATGRVRVDYADPITGAPANRGLGVVIAGSGKYLSHRGMGTTVSPRAFGHPGAGGQVAWGDPQSGISFSLLTSGMDANPLRSAHLCAAASNRAGACAMPVPTAQKVR